MSTSIYTYLKLNDSAAHVELPTKTAQVLSRFVRILRKLKVRVITQEQEDVLDEYTEKLDIF
jgi:hypothetical protein